MNNEWRPGILSRLPWSAFAALLGAVLSMVGSIAVLISSNGVPIAKWTIQPTVYLSITSTITNILIHYALAQGVTTAWWSRALHNDVKIADLHQYWASGTSLLSAMTSGRHFNIIALAAIFVAISPANGPFLQRASRVVISANTTPTQLSIQIARQIPQGFTAMIEGRQETPAFFTEEFAPVVSDFYDRSSIQIADTGCIGNCSANIVAAGFAVNCSSYQVAYNLTPVVGPGSTFNTSQPNVAYGLPVFQVWLLWGAQEPGNLQINVQYKPEGGCEGNLEIKNCTLSLATVQYAALINGKGSSISLPSSSTIYDDVIAGTYTTPVENQAGDRSTIGGLYLALNNRFASWANMRFVGAIGYELLSSGPTANQFVIPSSVANGQSQNCSLKFNDPMDSLIANARELMFRAAVAASNSSTVQVVNAVQHAPITVYETDFHYLGLATLFTFLAIVLVIPTFFGYWNLGRRVSMSPIEIAKAFNAPILRNNDSNADADALIDELGEINVRYGVVEMGYGLVECQDGDTMKGNYSVHAEAANMRLEMAPSDRVVTPQKSWVFSGS